MQATLAGPAALRVDDLTVSLRHANGTMATVVENVSLSVAPGEVVGLVGESGCGKSVTAQAMMGVLPRAMKITSGRIHLGARELTAMSERELRDVRGREIAMVFQDPMSSLNPLIPVGAQIAETLIIHKLADRRQAYERALELLRIVRIPSPEQRMSEYPHRMSGGMRQRVMIAIALACNPSVLIADEPTTALDVTIQRQIMNLLQDLRKELGIAVLMITHDFGLVREFADKVTVMYAGKVVEQASCSELFSNPVHPYSRKLLAAMPHFTRGEDSGERQRLVEIPGSVPPLGRRGNGCRFGPRCDRTMETCKDMQPGLENVLPGHAVACFHPGAVDAGR